MPSFIFMVVFCFYNFSRNNQYAISTHFTKQYAGDGVVSKALGYGVDSSRVDGNDPIAVYNSVEQARQYIIENSSPFFIELMTYR